MQLREILTDYQEDMMKSGRDWIETPGRIEICKIIVIAILIGACLLLTYYSHFILKTEIIFTHLFYLPVILAGLWWSRKGIALAGFFAIILLFSHIISPLETPFWADLIRSSMFIAVGTVVGLLSERKAVLENRLQAYSERLEDEVQERTSELRESEGKLQAILNSVGDDIVVMNKDLNITWANKIASERYGTILNKKCYEAHKLATAPCSECIVKETFADGEIRSSEEEFVQRDGTHLSVIITCAPIRDHGGEISHVVGVFHDITRQKKAENELEEYREHLEELVRERTDELRERTTELTDANIRLQELDRLKSMFIATMSHELRTPLNSILGFTGILLQGMTGEITGEQQKQLCIVQTSAHHLLDLINDVIEISKIEAGKAELRIEEFDLAELVRETGDSFTPAAARKHLVISLDTPEEFIIESDKRKIKQVITNLVSNALKYTDAGEIEVRVTKNEKTAEISVKDTGIGIKAEDMEKLFLSFSQIHTEGRLNEGTGLGLYLTKKILDLLGGEITVKSEFGKGSTFSFMIPLKYRGGKYEKNPDN